MLVIVNQQIINHKSIGNLIMKNHATSIILTLFSTCLIMTNVAKAAQDITPSNMTCQEFLDMNPKSYTPIAFWVLNKDTDFKGGDYVDWSETETVATPKAIELCKKSPASKLESLKEDLEKAVKKVE